jgi:YhcH/YjgK/YiaL family protein
MILSSISDAKRYFCVHPLLKDLFEYLQQNDLSEASAGRIEIHDEDLFINVAEPQLIKADEQKLEVHRAYLDVHIPLTGAETIGWRHLDTIDIPSEKTFDTENDFALYNVPASAYIDVRPGEFLVVFPEDAHAPIIGEGKIKKLIAKIKL